MWLTLFHFIISDTEPLSSGSLIINLLEFKWSLSLGLTGRCFPLQDEGDGELAGEAAQPPEAHHPEDGDHLGGRRVRRPRERQGQDVAELESEEPQRTDLVALGPADEGHRVQEKMKGPILAKNKCIIKSLGITCIIMTTAQCNSLYKDVALVSTLKILDIVAVDLNEVLDYLCGLILSYVTDWM